MKSPGAMRRLDADVAIVGAGPAGCALAVALERRGLRVALLDRRASPDFRVGETFPPNVGTRLRRLGLWSSFVRLDPTPLYGVLTAWGQSDPASHSYFGHPDGCGWVVDRARFDTMMRRAAIEAGAVMVAPARFAGIDRTGVRGWRLHAAGGEGEVVVDARFVVDGSGRGAACAVKIGARSRRLDELVGLVWRLEREGAGEPTLVEATPSGWWYSAAAPSGKTVVVFLTDAKEARGLRVASGGWPRQLLSDAPLMAQRVRGSSPEELPRVVAAFTQTLEPAAGDGWLAVGDAATSRDPISGSGVDFALASAELAAEAIVCAQGGDGSAMRVYAALIRRDATAYLNERRSVYLAEDRWSDAPFWQRRREPLFVRPFADLTTTPR